MTKVENLLASVNKSEEKAAKCQATIERHFKQLEKKVATIEKFGYKADYSKFDFTLNYSNFKKQMADIENQKWVNDNSVNEYWEICEVCNKLEDINNATKKLIEVEQTLENWKEKLNAAQIKEDFISNANVPQVIIDFVESWKKRAIEWHMKNDDRPNAESIERHMENEKNIKILDLVSRVNSVVGKITDARHLEVSASGNLNGVIVGEKGKARVETITAGGWNIQCWHFRTLVTKL